MKQGEILNKYLCVVLFLSSAFYLHASAKDLSIAKIKREISKYAPKGSNNFYDEFLVRTFKKIKPAELRQTAEKKFFAKWKIYEDKYLSFKYPDDKNITLEVNSKPFPVMGIAVGTTENSYFRCYRLKIGKYTYCTLMLDKADLFDDGVCFCGAVVCTEYIFKNNALFRIDFLKCGYVKKFRLFQISTGR